MRSSTCVATWLSILYRRPHRKIARPASRRLVDEEVGGRRQVVTEQERKALVYKYKDGYRAVAEALAGAADRELDARPAPNKWTRA